MGVREELSKISSRLASVIMEIISVETSVFPVNICLILRTYSRTPKSISFFNLSLELINAAFTYKIVDQNLGFTDEVEKSG